MKYRFADTSHHEGDFDAKHLADAGHRLEIIKASDSYHMPDINGKYDFAADRHHDPRFVENVIRAREQGLLVAPYQFVRFDRPLPLSDKTNIQQKNLDYLLEAIAMLPAQYQKDLQNVAMVDVEQPSQQLINAGLSRGQVSNMTRAIVDLYLNKFETVIMYSGTWWTNQWLSDPVLEWLSEQVTWIESEYYPINSNNELKFPYSQRRTLSGKRIPTIPNHFSDEFATSKDDLVGKLFAWQYTAKSTILPGTETDENYYAIEKEKLYEIFLQDGAVDPPGNGNGISKEAVYNDFTDIIKVTRNKRAKYAE